MLYEVITPPPSLAKLTKLQLLHLERGLFAVSGYSDISLLKDFSHIKEIYLNGIYFTGILTQNPNKDSLKTMTVVGSASRYSCDLSIFNDCPELSTLILYGVNFSNPKCELKNLPKLNQLEITYCNLAGEISLTNGIGSLKTLSLANNVITSYSIHYTKLYETEWVAAMDSMQAPAKITDAQKQIILQYLQSKSRFTPE